MIKFLKNDEIERSKWDDCIKRSQEAVPYAFSWFLDNVSPGWCALTDDDYTCLFPLPQRQKGGIRYVFTPAFVQNLGLFTSGQAKDVDGDDFLGAIPKEYRLTDLALNFMPGAHRGEISERFNQTILLDRPYDELYSRYSEGTKRNLRKIDAGNITLSDDIRPSDAVSLFRGGPGKRISGLRNRDYSGLEKLIQFCTGNGNGRISGVLVDGKLVYSIFIIETCSRILMLLRSTSETGKNVLAGHYLVDSIIRTYSGSGKTLDFAGSSIPSIQQFNYSFGASDTSYYRLYINDLPGPVKFFRRILSL